MATIYGNTTNHWRCYINTWSSEDAASISAGLTVGIQDCGWGFQIWTGIVGHASANGSDSEVNTSFNTSTGSWSTKDITSASQRFAKGHSAYNVTLSGWVRNQSGYMNGTSSASQTITVPALAHHYISFDANGGTGAPSRVDKWYGENLTIPSTKPTRTNYEFLGWSKTSTGVAEYQPGQTYNGTPDADYTLYAVWKLLYVPPKFTDGLAIRTNSIISTTPDYSGGYCYASFTYKVDTTIYSDNVAKSITCYVYADGDSSGIPTQCTGDLDKASGTVNVHFQASINSVYYIKCVLIDTKDGMATIARSITTGVVPMEVASQGKSVGILSAAPSSSGLKLGGSGNPDFLLAADTTNNQLESMVQIQGSTSATGQGELTLSTQGLDSEGNVARGTINLVADSINLNGLPFMPRQWVFYEIPANQVKMYRPNPSTWYNNNGILSHCEGPNSTGFFDLAPDKTYITLHNGLWEIAYSVTGACSTRVLSGIFDDNGIEVCSATALARNNDNGPGAAVCHYARNVKDTYNVHLKAYIGSSGDIFLSRKNSYVNLKYLGPYIY